MNHNERNSIKSKLDQIGKGFCLAKWYELDLDLSSGQNRSCDLVSYHSVPIDDLRKNSSLFHNSNFKKVQRQFMLIDIQPKECALCWKHESTTKKISPRLEKNLYYYPHADLEKIITDGAIDDFLPKKIKITFSKLCNIRYIGDNPRNSSSWLHDIRSNGPYTIKNKPFYTLEFLKHNLFYVDQQDNPYIEIFWSWFYTAVYEVNSIVLQGGDPLMDRNFFRMMNFYHHTKNKNLSIEIISYCDPSGDRWKGFINFLKTISDNIKEVVLICKVSGWGNQLEYCNYGTDTKRLEKNLTSFLKSSKKNNRLIFQIDFHVLSYQSFSSLIKFILSLRKKFLNKHRKIIFFKIEIVSEPLFLHPSIYKNLVFHIDEALDFMKSNLETRGNRHIGFSSEEIQMVQRIKNIILENNIESIKSSFLEFIENYDFRTKQNFNNFFTDYQ